MDNDVFVVSALRTAFGKFCGTLRETPTYELGETNQELDEARGENYCRLSAMTDEITKCLIEEFGRRGRVYGGGYYEYPADGKKFIWGEGILSACGKACKNLW